MNMNVRDVAAERNIHFPHISNRVNRYSFNLPFAENVDPEKCFSKVLDLIDKGMIPAVHCVIKHREYLFFSCESIASQAETEYLIKTLLM